MRFKSCFPALYMLTIPQDPLSKPVGPGLNYEVRATSAEHIFVKSFQRSFGGLLFSYRQKAPGFRQSLSRTFKGAAIASTKPQSLPEKGSQRYKNNSIFAAHI